MAKIGLQRNIILSVKDYLESDLDVDGFSSLKFVRAMPEDSKIVLPEDSDPNAGTVSPPVATIYINDASEGERFEIGSLTIYRYYIISVFFYALSEGQLYDLLDYFFEKFNSNNYVPIYDYSDTGYPSDNKIFLNNMELSSVRSVPRIDMETKNKAMRYGGLTTTVGIIPK